MNEALRGTPWVPAEDFKRAFRSWPSGVAVVAVGDTSPLRGMTVSSLSSVSLSPPLLSICCDLSTRTLEALRSVGKFGVSVLAQGQSELSMRFASKAFEDQRFEGQAFSLGDNGSPLLIGAAAHFECSVVAIHPAGDHEIVLGAVSRAVTFEHAPLVYSDARYRELR
jgi:3-hydroxy-9,10-secoandrosta-1,3,5(10)-triene-9,17-dione monooxygenase reductase component